MDEGNCLFIIIIPAFFIESLTTSAKTENTNQKSPYTKQPIAVFVQKQKMGTKNLPIRSNPIVVFIHTPMSVSTKHLLPLRFPRLLRATQNTNTVA
jgi:hypothetical protein